MKRILLFTILAVGTTAWAAVPPIPRVPGRLLKPSTDAPAEPDDPAAIADRITGNTKAAGDKLKDADAGDATQKTQDDILKDIDKLLDQPPPPPMGGGGGGGSSGGGGASGGGQSGGGGKAGGGQSQGGGQGQGKAGGQRGGWRDREGNGGGQGQDKQAGGQAQGPGQGGKPMGDWSPMAAGGKPGDQKGGGGGGAGNNPGMAGGGGGGKSTPYLPLEEMLNKQVWGHLKEKDRQQMTQFYREQFISRYGDLLKQYYSSLADKEKKK